jgi:hypothetical protein
MLSQPPFGWRRKISRTISAVALCAGAASAQETGSAPPRPDAGAAAWDVFLGDASLASRVASRLAAEGFMDVAVVMEGSRVGVRFQNTRYRDRRRALEAAAALALVELPPQHELVLVASDGGVSLLSASYTSRAAEAERVPNSVPHRISLWVSDAPAGVLSAPGSNSPHGRVDLVVHPWFEANFSNTDPVAARTGIAPELRTSLRKGLTISVQILFTLQDDIPTGESRVRPGLLTLSQRVRLGNAVLVSATVGSFNPDRYGIVGEARAYSPSGRFSAGAEVALTGAASYGAHDWYYTPMKDPTALVDVAWRELAHCLTVRMTTGWFMPTEAALRLDVARQFGTTEVGFFAVHGETEANFGFRLVVPLPGARYGRLGRMRVRPAETFPGEYRYHARSTGGRMFRTGHSIDDEVRQWMAQ